MTTSYPLYVVDIIKEVVDSVNDQFEKDNIPIVVNYKYGRQIQILKALEDMNNSVDNKDKKYPLLALYQDFPEKRGVGYYSEVTFPKIVIANLTQSTDTPDVRYEQVFKPLLYPVYYQFLSKLARHSSNAGSLDPEAIIHTKWDRMGIRPEVGNTDYIDAIEITDLKFNFQQTKTC